MMAKTIVVVYTNNEALCLLVLLATRLLIAVILSAIKMAKKIVVVNAIDEYKD